MSVESSPGSSEQATLRPNAIGLPGVLFQSITTMAPASAVAFTVSSSSSCVLVYYTRRRKVDML